MSVLFGIFAVFLPRIFLYGSSSFARFFLCIVFKVRVARLVRNLNRRDSPPGSSLVSVELTSEKLSATGSFQRFARVPVGELA